MIKTTLGRGPGFVQCRLHRARRRVGGRLDFRSPRSDGPPRPRASLFRAQWQALVLAAVTLFIGGPASAVETFPVEEVAPGMRGVGRSVFQGSEIEEFGIEIIGVLESARPQGDLILFRGEGEFLEHTGISQGMSGSPVYIDGRLLGAIAFAYPGAKDPIGAITPIGEMLTLMDNLGPAAEGAYPSLGDTRQAIAPRTGKSPSSSSFTTPSSGDSYHTGMATSVLPFDAAWNAFVASSTAEGAFLSDAPSQPTSFDPGIAAVPLVDRTEVADGLTPIGTPISFSGWSPRLHSEMTEVLGNLGFAASPVASGRRSLDDMETSRLEPGSAVGLRMIGGDADIVAIGTVTHVEGDRIVAFGHPMIQSGAVAFPMTGAWIHTVLANRSVSMKMGSSTGELGGIWNDRRPGVAGTHGEVPSVIPVTVSVHDDEGKTDNFNYSLARHPMLTPFFLPWTVTNSYLAEGWVSGDASIRTETEVFFGGRSVRRVERIAADVPGTALGADITLPAVLVSINPWEPVHIDSLHVTVDYERGNPEARITDVHSTHRRAHTGDVVTVSATIEPFRGQSETRTFDIEIPPQWAGRSLRIYVGANSEFATWDQERIPDRFVPHSLDQMVELIERMPDDSKLTVRVYDASPGVLLQGVELSSLPPSMVAAASRGSRPGGIQPTSLGLLEERHHDTPYVLSSGSIVLLDIAAQ